MKSQRIKKHPGRPDLVGEHPLGDVLQVILIVIFLVVWIADSFIWHFSDFPGREASIMLRIIAGTALAIPAWILVRGGLRTVFGIPGEKPEVFRTGAFSLVRHPIYLGSILFQLSLVVFTLSLASAGLWLIITGFYYYISRYEEKALTEQFGEEYEQYKKDVPMLFPRLGGR